MSRKIIRVELYKTFFKDKAINKRFEKQGYLVEEYAFFKEEKKRFLNKKEYIAREFVCLLKLFFKIKDFRNNSILCLGGYYSTLLICRLFSFLLGNQFHLYLYNFYIHEAGEKEIVKKTLRFLLHNRKLTLIVQSPDEVSYYHQLTDIPIHFVPYCADIPENKLEAPEQTPTKEYIFTGGYTNRDYPLMIACAKAFPECHFVFAVSSLNTEVFQERLPENITVYKDIPKTNFDWLLAHATLVVVPLKKDVGSSGQMLCIGAMQNKKPIIYSDISSINYYFTDDSGIAYKLNDPESLQASLHILIRSHEKREQMGQAAYLRYINHFTTANRNQALFHVINNI